MKRIVQYLTRSKSPKLGAGLLMVLAVMLCSWIQVSAKGGNYQYRIIVEAADTATIDADLNIVITSRGQATDTYTVDISKLTIGTDDETTAFFAKYSDNVVSFIPDLPNKVVKMHFLPPAEGAHPFTSVTERNDYLKDKLTSYKANLQSKP